MKQESQSKKILERAKQILHDETRMESINSIWIILDYDDDPNFDTVLEEAKKLGINAVYSNQAFELWFVLHYVQTTRYINRKDYEALLTQYMRKKYQKNDKDHYHILKKRIDRAINHAKIGHQQFLRDNKKPSESCSLCDILFINGRIN